MPCPPGRVSTASAHEAIDKEPGRRALSGRRRRRPRAGSRHARGWPSLWNGVHSSKEEPMPDLSYRQPGLIMRKTGSTASNRQLRDLQKDLRRLGYLRSGIDGNFGDQTELAVKGLQHDLLEGAIDGDDGTPAVLIRSYNRGRVTSITGEVDQNLVACISDMLDDANFATLPSTADPAAE